MNCHTFSTGLSSGHLGGSAMMVMLAGTTSRERNGVKPDDRVILNPPVNLVEGSRVQPRLEAKN
jgi:hypothetical protein